MTVSFATLATALMVSRGLSDGKNVYSWGFLGWFLFVLLVFLLVLLCNFIPCVTLFCAFPIFCDLLWTLTRKWEFEYSSLAIPPQLDLTDIGNKTGKRQECLGAILTNWKYSFLLGL